ncbi:MAG TPA: bifunctional nuclease domain-containing protein [Egicoccus sp.]|nr:bifunctional nuclease domain-containing protein [Egicoccus sp.]HSK23298.1 bifunctional nuclease domain-containing protein [Egicoccus sp.]
MDDASLVRQARTGQPEAFAALFQRYEAPLHAVAAAMLGDRDVARDVVQDTALVALNGLDRLRNPDLVGAWLSGICRNLCRRRLRSRLRAEWSWTALQGGRVPLHQPDQHATPEEAIVRAEAAEAVRRAVADLPDGQRDAVQLFYLDDHSYREVGEALGLEVNAVKARLHRARRGLRPHFHPQAAAADSPLPTRPSGMRENPGSPPTRTSIPEERMTTTDTTTPVELEIADVRRRTIDGQEQYVVVLQAATGVRLPIWIGPSESIALALRLTGTPTPRPLTYETMTNLLAAADARLTEIVITKVEDGVFYADAVVEGVGGSARVDLRPSDALNLALAAGSPIRASAAALAQGLEPELAHATRLEDFPDDAASIAADIRRQWEVQLERSAEPDAE